MVDRLIHAAAVAGWATVALALCFSFAEGSHRRLLQEDGVPEEQQEGSDDSGGRPIWVFLIIPIISGLVGYITNVVALKMTFFPIEFWGWKVWQPKGQPFGLFGWQGIVPAKASQMAGQLTDLFLEKLIDVKEVFSRVDPQTVRKECLPGSKAISRKATDEIVKSFLFSVWTALPQYVKNEVVDVVMKESEEFIYLLMDNLKEHIMDVLDLRKMVEREAERSKRNVVDMFLKVGANEYTFVERSGLYFGFIFGIVQSVVYKFYDEWWILPLAGLFVGFVTNFLAIKLIFEPAKPIRFLGMTIQGVFLKRQQEAAEQIAELSESHYLKPDLIMPEIVKGEHKDKFAELLGGITDKFLERSSTPVEKLATNLVLGPAGVQQLKMIVVEVVQREIHKVLPLSYKHMEEAMQLKATLSEKLRALPPEEFIGTLRPVFREDEMKLILVGAILGMLVGFLQQFALFIHVD